MFLKKVRNFSNSLLFRLTLLYALAFTVLSSIGFLVFYYRIFAVTMESLDDELHAEVHKYASLLEKSGYKGIKAAIKNEGKFEGPEDGFYRLLDVNGNTLISTDMTLWQTIIDQDTIINMRNTGLTSEIQTLTVQGRDDKARAITAMLSPDYILQIGESLKDVDKYLSIFLRLFSILVTSLIVVSTLIGWFLAKQATSDMQEVTDTAEEIYKGVYNRRVQVTGRLKEIKRLGTTFNRMLDRIQALLKSMKEINDNIAHDLRSPLARIRGIAEMNLLKENSIEGYKEMATGTIEECDVLIQMINTMLDITEAEAGVNGSQHKTVELVSLIQEACELFQPIAQSKNIKVKTNLPESLDLKSDRKKLQRIVSNLLENAIKYSAGNKTVAVSASSRNGEIVIEVEDSGIGISEKDLPHIFERFYRCDRSRRLGGVGLGLSLVKAYTESINGTVHVKSVFNQGSCFTLIFKR
jgi:signal transduction histidine kinase